MGGLDAPARPRLANLETQGCIDDLRGKAARRGGVRSFVEEQNDTGRLAPRSSPPSLGD